jgi:hypothetical protein
MASLSQELLKELGSTEKVAAGTAAFALLGLILWRVSG